jgi:hypothetical protein
MNKHQVTDSQYAQALAAGQAEAEAEFRAQAALCARVGCGSISIADPSGQTSSFLRSPWQGPTAIEQRDIHISLHGLIVALLPAMLPSQMIIAVFASRGGQSTLATKRQSAQANGRKGGRPRKRKAA